MTAIWSHNPLALPLCPPDLRPAVVGRVQAIDGWSPWAKGTLPTNPLIVAAPVANPEKRPAPDGWRYLGPWDPGELYALRTHFPDCDTAWIVWVGPDANGAPLLVTFGEVFL